MSKLKSQMIDICVHRNLLLSVSAWVFPGVSILYVEKTKEVEFCWGIPYPPANHAGEVHKGKGAVGGGLNLCFIVVVLVIVWGIIFSGYV